MVIKIFENNDDFREKVAKNVDFIGKAEGYEYFCSQGNVFKKKYKNYYDPKKMTVQDKTDLLYEIVRNFNCNPSDFEIAIFMGNSMDFSQPRDYIMDICDFFNNSDYHGIVVDNIDNADSHNIKDLDLLNSHYRIMNFKENFLDGCTFVINLEHRGEFLEDCFRIVEKYNSGFIFKYAGQKGAVVYRYYEYSQDFRSLVIPNFNWFNDLKAIFIHNNKLYRFDYDFEGILNAFDP